MKPTQEQVITWAREAGVYHIAPNVTGSLLYMSQQSLYRGFFLAYEAGRKDAFQDGAKAMFDALLFRVANNWHPRAQEQCDVENEWATAWAADALDEVSPEDCAEWKSIKESWKDGYEAGRKDENEACAELCEYLPADEFVDRSDATIWDVATLECAAAIRARMETNNAEWNEYRGREQ